MNSECQHTSTGSNGSNDRKRENSRDNNSERPRDEGPRKRPKRGRYVAKACADCQRRKTKCKGGYPCTACIAKGLNCVVRNADIHRDSSRVRSPQESTATYRESFRNQSKDEVMAALSNIQGQLKQILEHDGMQSNSWRQGKDSPTRVQNTANSAGQSYTALQSQVTPKSDTEVFSGEPSIIHVLHEMEGQLESLGMRNTFMTSPPPSLPLTPIYDQRPLDDDLNPIQRALDIHGIVPDREQWNDLLSSFVDEVHILYPFLHLPVLRSTYADLWDRFLLLSGRYKETSDRIKIAQVLFCLATGRCNESTRKDTEGHHSAGWSLFQAGMDVLGDPLEILDDFSVSLPALQAILLAVIYLFRIDANNKTEKFLALVVSHSHLLGLHRKRVTDESPIFEAEMFRRLWWCTYIMDRRLAIDTGRPFLIQDVNTDVPVPLELGEDWLSQHIDTHLTSDQLRKEVDIEVNRNISTPLSHIAAMVDFSRVVGKVWEAYYGALDRSSSSTSLTTEYLEFLISSIVQKESPIVWSGSEEPFHVQFAGIEWWLIKQKMLMRIRWAFLRLLIRNSSLSSSLSTDEANSNGFMCLQLCRTVVLEFNQIPDKYPKHTFPFINYVATASMIALGLTIKQPSYKSLDVTFIAQAAHMLERFCTQTWVSGRIIRAVTRINQVTALVFDGVTRTGEETSQSMANCNCIPPPDSTGGTHQSLQNMLGFPIDLGSRKSGDKYADQSHSSRSSDPCKISQAPNITSQRQIRDDSFGLPSTLPLEDETSMPSSALGDLVMADFDFEEGLQHGNQLHGNWPCLPEFFDVGAPLNYGDVAHSLDVGRGSAELDVGHRFFQGSPILE